MTQTWNDAISFGLNKGAEYVFLINNDTIFTEDVFSVLTEYLIKDATIGVIGPLTNCPGDQPIQDVRRHYPGYIPSDSSESIKSVSKAVKSTGKIMFGRYVNGFFMGFSKEALMKNVYLRFMRTYYFNPLYRNFSNEKEFQQRLKKKKLRSAIATNAFVFHYKDVSQRRYLDGKTNMLVFRPKHSQ